MTTKGKVCDSLAVASQTERDRDETPPHTDGGSMLEIIEGKKGIASDKRAKRLGFCSVFGYEY